MFVAHRAYWLASDRDSWTGAGVVDVNGRSGRYLGQQAETRLRWEAVPGSLQIETGLAFLFGGHFRRHAPNASGNGDPLYAYMQGTFSF